jgi:hypothetical protein
MNAIDCSSSSIIGGNLRIFHIFFNFHFILENNHKPIPVSIPKYYILSGCN